ncbi:MAG: 50S ribosomal protein L32 [Myxococcota bacterium]
MAVPKKRKSKAKTRSGRSHHALRAPGLSSCSHCGALREPHRTCPECGFYNGRQIVEMDREEGA